MEGDRPCPAASAGRACESARYACARSRLPDERPVGSGSRAHREVRCHEQKVHRQNRQKIDASSRLLLLILIDGDWKASCVTAVKSGKDGVELGKRNLPFTYFDGDGEYRL